MIKQYSFSSLFTEALVAAGCCAAATVAFVFVSVAASQAANPVDKCEASKLKAMGKYTACRLKAEAKGAIKGEATDLAALAKCGAKFDSYWVKSEARADGLCADPPGSDQTTAESTSTLYADWAAGYLQGGSSDVCESTCGQCTTDLGTCNGSLSSCQTDFGVCTVDLGTCTASAGTCPGDLSACQGDLGTCNGDLSTCDGNLSSCQSSLGTCPGDLSTCQGDLGTCNGDLSTCQTSLGTCPVDLADSQQDLVQCEQDAGICDGSLGQCTTALSTCQGGSPNILLATGQTTSYTAGDDGELQTGLSQAYVDNGDGTITDLNTGLMWEKKDNNGGLHDYLFTYNWTSALTSWLGNINAENGTGFAGYDDWRIPNVRELQSIVDYSQANPAVDAVFNNGCTATCFVGSCSCTRTSAYWSSTAYSPNTVYRWFVNFSSAKSDSTSTSYSANVRAVRGGL